MRPRLNPYKLTSLSKITMSTQIDITTYNKSIIVEFWAATKDILIVLDQVKTLKNNIMLYLQIWPYYSFAKVTPIVPL